MICGGCGNQHAFRTFSVAGYAGQEWCDRCGVVAIKGLPDVFWDGKAEEGLADDPQTGKARVFSSRQAKAAYLRERNLTEAGDRVHGSRMTVTQHKEPDHRASAEAAIRKVRAMGQDVRRQEYLRIVKEAQSHGQS